MLMMLIIDVDDEVNFLIMSGGGDAEREKLHPEQTQQSTMSESYLMDR